MCTRELELLNFTKFNILINHYFQKGIYAFYKLETNYDITIFFVNNKIMRLSIIYSKTIVNRIGGKRNYIFDYRIFLVTQFQRKEGFV